MSAFGYRKVADLPRNIPVFPLPGAILFPRATLPLNIFEPRYLNMVDDALSAQRLIGMIQPAPIEQGENRAGLAEIGTLGRITSFSETEDGRYLVTLTGICRYRVERELESDAPYRRINAVYDQFGDDLKSTIDLAHIDRERLRQALRLYVDSHGYQADWSAVDEAPPEALVNAVAALCPFDPPAKQALLEAPTLAERCGALIALLEISADPDLQAGPKTLQ